jgi:hypothetical protein
VKVVKNKLAPPFRQAEFDIDYGRGISRVGCVLDVAVQAGVVERSGSFFAFGQGAARAGTGEGEGLPRGAAGAGGGDRGRCDRSLR